MERTKYLLKFQNVWETFSKMPYFLKIESPPWAPSFSGLPTKIGWAGLNWLSIAGTPKLAGLALAGSVMLAHLYCWRLQLQCPLNSERTAPAQHSDLRAARSTWDSAGHGSRISQCSELRWVRIKRRNSRAKPAKWLKNSSIFRVNLCLRCPTSSALSLILF